MTEQNNRFTKLLSACQAYSERQKEITDNPHIITEYPRRFVLNSYLYAFQKIILVIFIISLITLFVKTTLKLPPLQIDKDIYRQSETVRYLKETDFNYKKNINDFNGKLKYYEDRMVNNIPADRDLDRRTLTISYYLEIEQGASDLNKLIKSFENRLHIYLKLKNKLGLLYESLPFIIGLSVLMTAVIIKFAGNILSDNHNIDELYLYCFCSKLYHINIVYNTVYYLIPILLRYTDMEIWRYIFVPFVITTIFFFVYNLYLILTVSDIIRILNKNKKCKIKSVKSKMLLTGGILSAYFAVNILLTGLLCYPYAEYFKEMLNIYGP